MSWDRSETVVRFRRGHHYAVDPATGCWNWLLSLNQAGYPHSYKHRLAWEDVNGPCPDGYHVHHRCENRKCINPAHLEALPPREHLGPHWLRRCGNPDLTLDDYRAMRAMAEDPELTQEEIGRRFGVDRRTVRLVTQGKRWREELGGEPVQVRTRICGWCGGLVEGRRNKRYCCKDHRLKANARRTWDRTLARRAAA